MISRTQLAVLGGAIVAALVGADLYYVRTPQSTAQSQTADTPCVINGGVGSIAMVESKNCRNRSGRLLGIRVVNTSMTPAFLRLYNLPVAPVCTANTGFQESIPIPPNFSGIVDPTMNFFYNMGIGYCLTGGGGATDNTAPPAGVYGNIRTGN
jgi:hypothetical protein